MTALSIQKEGDLPRRIMAFTREEDGAVGVYVVVHGKKRKGAESRILVPVGGIRLAGSTTCFCRDYDAPSGWNDYDSIEEAVREGVVDSIIGELASLGEGASAEDSARIRALTEARDCADSYIPEVREQLLLAAREQLVHAASTLLRLTSYESAQGFLREALEKALATDVIGS